MRLNKNQLEPMHAHHIAPIQLIRVKMKLLILFLLAGVAVVTAQIPQRCISPPAWVAHVSSTEIDFINGRTQMRGRIAYDEANERFRILDQYEFRNPNSDYFFGRYFFFKEKIEYRANFTTKSCEKRFLNGTFRPFSIPFDARYIDTVEIGSNLAPGDGVEVYIWGGETPGGGFYTGTWTVKDCLPVSDFYNRGPFMSTSFFYDVEGGFNPDDFVPPDFC